MSTGYISRIISTALIAGSLMVSQAYAGTIASAHQTGSSDISAFTKWTSLLPRYESQHAGADAKCYGPGCLNKKWEALLSNLEGKPVEQQVKAVNSFFNGMKYISDQQNYGVADYWQTPYEMMERGGDCEDYAIAKYISLKRLGVSESDMRIIIVRDQSLGGIMHAVLQVDVDGEKEILDNQAKIVKTASQVRQYSPIFAINEAKWWAYN